MNITALVVTNWTTLASAAPRNVTDVAILDDVTTGEATATATLTDSAEQVAVEGFIDGETRAAVIEAVHCYLLPVVFVLGVSGNVMSMVVLLVHGLNNSTNVLLLGVTVSDLCFLLSMFARKVSCLVSHVDVTAGRTLETALIPNVYMVNRIFSYTTPFLTMLITLERCLAVTFPLKVQSIVTALRMKIAVTSVFLFSIIAQFPFFFIYTIQWTTDDSGRSVPRLQGTRFFQANFDVISAYNNLVLSAIFNYVPMVVVIICTVIVITTVRKSSRWRKITSQVGGERADERRMTRLLMTVVGAYIACYFPRSVVLVANSLAPQSFNSLNGRYRNLFYVISALQLILFAVNSSVNFVIYMVMSRKFLHTYMRIFLCQKQPKEKGSNHSSGMSKRVTSLTNDMSALSSD